MSASGHCLCEGVSYRVNGELRPVVNCHCDHCQRLTGNHMAGTACLRSELEMVSEETLAWYSHQPDVFYGFCRECGATVFWRDDTQPTYISITAGTLDKPTGLDTVLALFCDDAADYHHLDTTIESEPGDRTAINSSP